MYLMNVPPVAATRTEWRTCGPPGGYSLPVCFNDSDTELSIRGSPISNKVQMIIESLRSTQSSLEMGDEIEGNLLSGQEVCKVAAGSFVGAKSKIKSPPENQQTGVSSPTKHESSDTDSDDSVDRGIEEAILEYLKEKDDHKRKAEPCTTFLQSSKIPRKTPPVPEVSKLKSDTNSFLSSQFPKSVIPENPIAPATVPIKKYIKTKASLHDSTARNLESNTVDKSLLPRSPSKSKSLLNKAKCPVKVEEDSDDSSSDDGIEEAIQRYQLEKKEQQNRDEEFKLHEFTDESDSTSDDGIEEAIRTYQLQQLQEKSVSKPFLHKRKAISKVLMNAVGGTSTETMKKHRLRQKKNRVEKEVKSVLLPPSSFFTPKNADSQRGKGNGLFSFKVESYKEQPSPAPPKVNTTAELMCAEAILDISKTVMPAAFQHSVGLSNCAPAESVLQSSLPEDNSSDSSIDSEDGIEQEIMKFLEQKAQMHKQPASSAMTQEPSCVNEPEKMETKRVVTQKKPSRLSLTQRRQHTEENSSISTVSGIDKDTSPKPLHEQRKELSPLALSERSQTQSIVGLHKTEQSGDKSSSLDSDEDLDTAIKDLLKTKKKSKRKTRDLKRKSRKCLKEEEPLLANSSQTKKVKADPTSKRSALKKVHRGKRDIKDKPILNKKTISQSIKSKALHHHEGVTETLKGTEGQEDTPLLYNKALQTREDSSSVDSDDSIEQEIRKFLAEKAEKISNAERGKDGEVSRNGTAPLRGEDIKQEDQLAEIPRKSGRSPLSSPESKPPHDGLTPQVQQSSLPDNAIFNVSAQPRLPSVQCGSLSPLEPADGAGAARSEQSRPIVGRGDIQDTASPTERIQPVLSPNVDLSESIKWRRSLGLPTSDIRFFSRTPFHITSSKISETALTAPPYQGRGINLKSQAPFTEWSSARTSRTPFTCSTETTVPTQTPILNLFSVAKQHQGMSFTQSLAPGHRSQCPIRETESMVHMPKDKSVFVELESDRTNHVQVRSRERNEGKERADLQVEFKREVESLKIDAKDVHLEEAEEEFIDEADSESGNGKNPEKKQGFPTLSLSSAIDPGFTFRPCIALTTEERSRRFNRRYLTEHCKQGISSLNKNAQHVKRKLLFIPVSRGNEEARKPC
ncbi:protein phosphatase 1 regulatory subunit 26 [Aulostomus maculatus]